MTENNPLTSNKPITNPTKHSGEYIQNPTSLKSLNPKILSDEFGSLLSDRQSDGVGVGTEVVGTDGEIYRSE